jgi:hypothetical protein
VLEKELADQTHGSPGSSERLANVDAEVVVAVNELQRSVRTARTRKALPRQ